MESRIQYQAAYDTGPFRPLYFGMSNENEQQALFQRVLKNTPTICPLTMDRFIKFVKDNLHKFIPMRRVRPDDIDTYLRGSNASPQVKMGIKKAYEDLLDHGITSYSFLGHTLRRKFTVRKSFVKVENLTYRSLAGTKEKAPRLIQGANPKFIALVGPFFSRLQRHFKQHWNEKHFIYFTSGATSRKMGQFLEGYENWKKFENDVSAFDSSISIPLCELEVWIAKKFGAPRAVVQLMEENINTRGFTMHGYKYRVKGTRKSGDPYTSLFNSVLNAMMHVFVYTTETGTLPDDVKYSMRMLVQGDDNLLLHRGDKCEWRQNFLRLGFDTESKYRKTLYDCEFCSSIIVDSAEGLVFVPKPGKLLAKFGYFINPPINTHPHSLLRGVILGFDALKAIRVYNSFFLGVSSWLTDVPLVKMKVLEHKFLLSHVHRNEKTDDFLYHRYGITPDMFPSLDAALKCGQMDHPYVQLLMDRDTDHKSVIYCR